jgi:hypothetical protein
MSARISSIDLPGVTGEYFTATPEQVDVRDARVTVTALVSGRFPGSPARLTFHFTVAGDRIAALEIQ